MGIFREIKYWIAYRYWWYFQATEKDKMEWDMMCYGTGIMKGGKRIKPENMFKL